MRGRAPVQGDQLVGLRAGQLAATTGQGFEPIPVGSVSCHEGIDVHGWQTNQVSDLVTGEAVPLEMRLAKVPSRGLAILLDWGLLAAIGIPIAIALETILSSADPALRATLGLL